MFDLILKNGRVFDGEKFLPEGSDVAIYREKIAGIGPFGDSPARKCIDCRGLTVCPGLIDAHTHLYPLSSIGIRPGSACIPFGVTSCCDAGSCGAHTFEASLPSLAASPVDVRCFLNVSSAGLFSLRSKPEDIDPDAFDEETVCRLFERYPQRLIGLKIRMGRECSLSYGKEPLIRAKKLASSLGVPLCVHVSDPAFPAGELAELLSKGDIFAHTCQGRGNGILDGSGHVDARIVAARQRGVLFDVADAGVHFSIEVFRRAAEDGFFPDLCGSDTTDAGVFEPDCFALPLVLSKQLSLGMPLERVLRMATKDAADLLGFSGGRLAAGAVADIAVFAVEKDAGVFCDRHGGQAPLTRLLLPRLTVRRGTVAWRDISFR